MTDVEFDARVTALEENGGTSPQNGIQTSTSFFLSKLSTAETKTDIFNIFKILDTIAFHAVLTSYDTISTGSTLLFNRVLLNEADG